MQKARREICSDTCPLDDAEARAMARGRTEGRAEGRAAVILHILDKHGVQLTDQQRRRIHTCTDLATLTSWLDATIEVDTAAELFG